MSLALNTGRLILRLPRMEDAERIAFHLNNFGVAGNLARVPYPYFMADAKAWLRTRHADLPPQETNFTIEVPGEGVAGMLAGRTVFVGGHGFVTARTGDAGSAIPATEAGCVLVAVGVEKQFAGSILMADPVRADVGEMLAGLRRDGVKRLVLATGDRAAVPTSCPRLPSDRSRRGPVAHHRTNPGHDRTGGGEGAPSRTGPPRSDPATPAPARGHRSSSSAPWHRPPGRAP